MQINRVFNWGTGNIQSDSKPAPPKKKGFLSKVKDYFSMQPSMPDLPEMKENIANTFQEIADNTTSEDKRLGYETAALIARYSKGLDSSVIFTLCNNIASGALAGPIGMAIPGFSPNPLLDKIAFNNPAIAEKAMVNSILLMENASDQQIKDLMPKAAEEFLKKAASDQSSPERAKVANEVLNIVNKPGISDQDKTTISKDSINVVKGQVDPLWVHSKSIEHYKNGSAASLEFSRFLVENMDKALEPVTNELTKASQGQSGTQKENAILSTAQKLSSGESDESKAMIGFQALRTISQGSTPNADNARELMDMMTASQNSKIAAAYTDIFMGGSPPSLAPQMTDLVRAGKHLNTLTNEKQGKAGIQWLDSYMNYMKTKTNNPVEKKIVETCSNIASKLPTNSRYKFSYMFFNLLSKGEKSTGAALISTIGYSQVKGKSTQYTSDRQGLLNTSRVYLEEIANNGAAAGNLAKATISILNEMNDNPGAQFSREVLGEIQAGISAPDRTLAKAGAKVINPMASRYESERKPKCEATAAVLKGIIGSTSDDKIRGLAQRALDSLDAAPTKHGYKNGIEALKIIESEKGIDPSANTALIFYNTMKPFAIQYSSERSLRTKGTVNLLNVLKDNETDPALKTRLEKTLDTIDIVEEKLPDKDGNLTISPSGYRGYYIGSGVLKNIGEGVKKDIACELAELGHGMIKPMSSEYSSERKSKTTVCLRLFNAIEKHADKPEQKQAAKAFNEYLTDLGSDAIQSVGMGGLAFISEGKPLTASAIAQYGLQFFRSRADQYTSERQEKSRVAGVILKHLKKQTTTDKQKKILDSGNKIATSLTNTGYGFRVLSPVLTMMSDESGDSLGLMFAKSGKSFIGTNFDTESSAGRQAKTQAAGAFLSQVGRNAEKQMQRGLAQMMSLYCTKSDKENGYKAANIAFDVLIEMENQEDSSATMEQMIEKIKEKAPDSVRDDLTKFMNSSLGSIYRMQETLDNVGESAKEIQKEEEFVIIGGVKVKKGGRKKADS